jgi:hypothetical protein
MPENCLLRSIFRGMLLPNQWVRSDRTADGPARPRPPGPVQQRWSQQAARSPILERPARWVDRRQIAGSGASFTCPPRVLCGRRRTIWGGSSRGLASSRPVLRGMDVSITAVNVARVPANAVPSPPDGGVFAWPSPRTREQVLEAHDDAKGARAAEWRMRRARRGPRRSQCEPERYPTRIQRVPLRSRRRARNRWPRDELGSP